MKFYLFLVVYFLALGQLNRHFSHANDRFSLRDIYPIAYDAKMWDVSTERTDIDAILSQPFHYLRHGAQMFAFVSADDKYVLKFHRYPFHMRRYNWLKHPFKKTRKERNIQRFAYHMTNYKACYETLQAETGCIWLQLNPEQGLNKEVRLIDKMGNHYTLPLKGVTCILQHRAQLIYPTLQTYLAEGQIENGKQAITHILELFMHTCKKGYVNTDSMLSSNIGLLPDRAIHIDMGDLSRSEGIGQPEQIKAYLAEVTEPLRNWLEAHSSALLAHYDAELARLLLIYA